MATRTQLNTGNNTNITEGGFEKATGFINITMKDEAGASFKVGSLPLKESVDVQKFIVDSLISDPTLLEKIVSKLEFNFQPANRKPGGFKL